VIDDQPPVRVKTGGVPPPILSRSQGETGDASRCESKLAGAKWLMVEVSFDSTKSRCSPININSRVAGLTQFPLGECLERAAGGAKPAPAARMDRELRLGKTGILVVDVTEF